MWQLNVMHKINIFVELLNAFIYQDICDIFS